MWTRNIAAMRHLVALLLALCVATIISGDAFACLDGQFQLLDACNVNADCGAGLFCSSCFASGNQSTICIRDQTTPISHFPRGTSLPFNRYAWLTTHNSFAIAGEPSATGSPLHTNMNQEDSVTSQLNNGVRGLMLDFYDFLGDVWLCHSEGGICYNHTAFQPASNTLMEIRNFLEANPTEVITVFLEDYVQAPKGVTKVFTNAGLMKYWFPVSKMPKNGGDWPTLDEMIHNNLRLLVFTSIESKEESEGVAYEWKYTVENMWGDQGMQPGLCPIRGESAPMDDLKKSLITENFFRDDPNVDLACLDNSDKLYDMLEVCAKAAGNRWTNFLAVDYYKRSKGGGALEATDHLNEELQGSSPVSTSPQVCGDLPGFQSNVDGYCICEESVQMLEPV